MTDSWRSRGWHIALILLCASVTWRSSYPLESTEASGGLATRYLFFSSGAGELVLLLALAATLWKPRGGSLIALLGCLLCLPLQLFVLAPGLFQRLFRGEASVPVPATAVTWNGWVISAIIVIGLTMLLSVRMLWHPRIHETS